MAELDPLRQGITGRQSCFLDVPCTASAAQLSVVSFTATGKKKLDPATGLPLAPAKSAKAERVPPGTVVRTGEVCPQSGVWCDHRWASFGDAVRGRFRKGETMPQLALNDRRIIPGLDWLLGMRVHRTNADWSLVSYSDEA